jgi:hypothetical protein
VGKKKNLQEKKELSYIRPLFNSLSFYENRGYISEPSQLHDVAGEPGSGRLRTGLITGGCLIQTVSNNRPVVVKTGIRKILTPGEGRRVRGGGGTKGGKGRERERERERERASGERLWLCDACFTLFGPSFFFTFGSTPFWLQRDICSFVF